MTFMKIRLSAFFPIALLFSAGAGHGQWAQSAGPKAGTVQSLSAAGGSIFVSTWNTILHSGDLGKTWSTDSGRSTFGNILLRNGEYITGSGSGVWKRPAAEGSGTWTQVGLPGRDVKGMAQLGPYLFADTYSGIFRSADGGNVWDSLPVGGSSFTSIMEADGALLTGSGAGGVYRSLDSGRTWTPAIGDIDTLYIWDFAATASAFFVVTNNGVYRSADRGASWNFLAVDSANRHAFPLAASGEDLYLGTSTGGVFHSTDNGASWTRAHVASSEWAIRYLAIVGSDIFAATGSEVFRSSDRGKTWAPTDLLGTSIQSFASLDGDLFAAAGAAGVYRSRDNGQNWTEVNRSIPSNATVYDIAVLGRYVLAGTAAYVFRSADRGESWQQFKAGIPNQAYVTTLFPSGPNLFAGTDGGLFSSTDSGETWKRAGDSTIAKTWPGPMAQMGRYLVTCGGHSRGLYLSSDGGLTWTSPDSVFSKLQIRALVAKDGFFFAAANEAYAQKDQPIGMYRSADSGATWTRINNGLTELSVRSLLIVNGALITGTRKGAFRSQDNGDSWIPIAGGNVPPILSLAASGQYLIAGVENGSAWRIPLSQATSIRVPYRPRGKSAVKRRNRENGRPYDIRGRDASGIAARSWKTRKPSSRAQ
jgi:photosystem II stability/assembly factor-like uncharacterized protein